MAHLTLRCLGTFHATLDDRSITDLESGKVRALLIYLAIESTEPHSREELIGLLWPDRPERAARANLRQAIANLRRALGDRSANSPFLIVSGDTVQFNRLSDYWLDVDAFEERLAAYVGHAHPRARTCPECLQYLQQAANFYRGEFLAQFYQGGAQFEEWALLKRERCHRLALDALTRLTIYHDRRQAYEAARVYAVRQLELDPWREEAHRQVMCALAVSGQRSAALAQYEKCRQILAKELGVEPESATQELVEKIKAGQLTPATDPIISSIETVPLIGRERELTEIDQLLANPACRVVTLTGPGGVGKTQLALHAAANQLGTFANGIRFIPLAGLNSTEALLTTLAADLGLTLDTARDAQLQVIHYLVRREMLIVLDNFEQLLSAGAETLASLIAGAARITLLVTSRERLNLRDEWVIDVRGLKVPPGDQPGDTRGYSAMQLFIDRVEHLVGPRSFSGDDWPHIANICRLTAGLPLAIELAAAWARHWSFADIASGLARTPDFAAAPLHDLPKRHQSLRAVFDQSWQLLTPVERVQLQALAVFHGTFDRAAAEQVAAVDPLGLAALVDKSLVQIVDDHRCVMPEVIRHYAAEQLYLAGTGERLKARHSAYFLRQITCLESDLMGPEQVRCLARIDDDVDNLRAALQWAITAQPAEALEISSVLWRYWLKRKCFAEGRYWLEKALNAIEAHRFTRHRAKVLTGLANLVWAQGDYPAGRKWARQSVLLWQTLNDRQGLAPALTILGTAAGSMGDHAEATAVLEESASLLIG